MKWLLYIAVAAITVSIGLFFGWLRLNSSPSAEPPPVPKEIQQLRVASATLVKLREEQPSRRKSMTRNAGWPMRAIAWLGARAGSMTR